MKTANLPQLANPHSFLPQSCARKVGTMKTPQQLSREAIEEFRAIYEEEFGKRLTDDEVKEIALRLLRFFGILSQPTQDKATDMSAARE